MDLRMTVNNIDTMDYNARLLNRTIGLGTVTVYDDWLKNASNPLYFGDQITYKQIKLSFLIKDTDDNSALMDISNLVAQLKKCTIKFSDMDFLYDCVVTDIGEPAKSILDGRFKLDVTLKAAYAYLPTVSQNYNLTFSSSKDSSIDVNIQGNIPVPIVVNAKLVGSDVDQNFKFNVPDNADTTRWIKNGFIARPIYINNMLIVDGETCKVYDSSGNAFNRFFGDFITLQPGYNTIPVGFESMNTAVQLQITISYKPRFM